ncbi:hypothetical protein GCM10027074_64730 [Streptomyces deserti]
MESLPTSKPHPARETRRTEQATSTEAEGRAPSAPGPVSSFVRFVICGGGVGLLAGAAVPLLATLMPWALANAVITVVSALLCTELHALFTFGTGRRPGRRRHLQSAGSAMAAYVVTCAAMAILHWAQASPGMLTEQAVYLGASALAGTGRFLILRLFVFTGDRGKGTTSVQENTAATSVSARAVLPSSAASAAMTREVALPVAGMAGTAGRRHSPTPHVLVRTLAGAAG